MRCDECKHWSNAEIDWEFAQLRMGVCKAIKQRSEITSAGALGVERFSDEWEFAAEKAMRSAKAIAVDGSGYYAAVRTQADFGCVLHEPTDLPPTPRA